MQFLNALYYAENFRALTEANLSPEDYAAAWERGKMLSIESVVTELLTNSTFPENFYGRQKVLDLQRQ